MTPVECEFESEVLAATFQGRWPERVDAELRAHVAACGICSDVAAIAGAIEDARAEMSAHVVLPDSGHVWWAAQLRARHEAAEAANRPMTAAQAMAFVGAVGLLGVCFRAAYPWLQSALGRITSSVAGLDTSAWLAPATRLLAEHGALALAMAAVLLLVPAAAYLAMGRD
jgi:hypothetical protein